MFTLKFALFIYWFSFSYFSTLILYVFLYAFYIFFYLAFIWFQETKNA